MVVYMNLVELEKGIFVDLSRIEYILLKHEDSNYSVLLGMSNGKEIFLKSFGNFEEARNYIFDLATISPDIDIQSIDDLKKIENIEPASLKEQFLGFFLWP